jgi:secreted PhoX family phosphatase
MESQWALNILGHACLCKRACAPAETLARILSSPQYAEVTGIYISYVDDFAYLALAIQHPEENTPDEVTDKQLITVEGPVTSNPSSCYSHR